jgi:hypothetical protein
MIDAVVIWENRWTPTRLYRLVCNHQEKRVVGDWELFADVGGSGGMAATVVFTLIGWPMFSVRTEREGNLLLGVGHWQASTGSNRSWLLPFPSEVPSLLVLVEERLRLLLQL